MIGDLFHSRFVPLPGIKLRFTQVNFFSQESFIIISEVRNDHLSSEVRKLTSAAVGGCQRDLDLLCNDVMTANNHLTDVASLLAKHLEECKA